MNPRQINLTVMLLLLLTRAPATTFYVDVNSTNPTPPYADWSTASTDIQSAIDASSDGDLILVTNGVYQTGGRVVYGSLTNRVVINKAVTVQSVNGPEVTMIQGYQVPGTSLGDSAVRCVYLAAAAKLEGFTLADGATRNLGDAVQERSGGGVWCASTDSFVSNCIVTSNSCEWNGAGVYSGTLYDCQIMNNTNRGGSGNGGGAAFSSLVNSTINSNYCQNTAGGVLSCTLSNCVVAGNSMGGVAGCVLDYCTIENNFKNAIGNGGGGALQSTLNHCLVCNNQSQQDGGGTYQCELNFCTISNNLAGRSGGGVYEIANSTNRCGFSCQVIGNQAGLYGGGLCFASTGMFIATNWNVSGWAFTSNSAARDGGGMYQLISAMDNCTFTGNSSGGNGGGFYGSKLISNCTFSGNFANANGGGAYGAVLNNCLVTGNQAGNGGGVYGYVNNCVLNHNVAATNGGGLYFFNGGTRQAQSMMNCAFTNNTALNGGGSYGGNFSSCVFFGNTALTNGGAVSWVNSQISFMNNCLVVSNQAAFGGGGFGTSFNGGTIVGNAVTMSGGGIYNYLPTASTNCVIKNNYAALDGGGVFNASLVNCLLTGNSAVNGGGAYGSPPLNNCTVVANVATGAGGGTYSPSGGFITSCIIYDNAAPIGANFSGTATCNYCCSTPLPSGNNSLTNDPLFVSFATDNFRLQTNSPCINVGNGSAGLTDLDGRPRVVGGKIDMGAYEFQGPGIGEFTAWLQQYGLPTSGSADYLDSDGDGMSNWQEWIAGTNPTNASSVLLLASPSNSVSGITVTWQSVSGITYYLQGSTNLPSFTAIASNLVGLAGTTSYTDTSATNGGPYFYRVGVQ